MKQLKLSIPNPCHERQALNKTSEFTFFCNVCKEPVVDLTQQTLDSDSIKDIKCVILSRKQLHWPQAGGSRKQISLSKPLLTATLLIGISVTALGAYQESLTIPYNYAFDLLKFPCFQEKDTALSIKGKVINDHHHPVGFAYIRVLKKNDSTEFIGIHADANGIFELPLGISSDDYDLYFLEVSYGAMKKTYLEIDESLLNTDLIVMLEYPVWDAPIVVGSVIEFQQN